MALVDADPLLQLEGDVVELRSILQYLVMIGALASGLEDLRVLALPRIITVIPAVRTGLALSCASAE